MAAIDDLINQIEDETLRERIKTELKRSNKQKKFGLVFEQHLPEATPLYDLPIKKGSTVAIRCKAIKDLYFVDKRRRPDFVCWLQNLPRKYWALCIPYEQNGSTKSMYPDFLIIRKDDMGYIVDILEPHDGSLTDNLGKAKGFAKYAKENDGIGRIQLIRLKNGAIRRLDMSKIQVQEQILLCGSDDQLNFVFDTLGFTG